MSATAPSKPKRAKPRKNAASRTKRPPNGTAPGATTTAGDPPSATQLDHITPALRPLAVPIDSLKPDPRNARKHNERNCAAIEHSLRTFGQQKPISADAEGIILAGNGTWEAAKRLGWTFIAAARSELTGAAARAFAIADNRTAELAEWDALELSETLAELAETDFDIEGLAFTDAEVDDLLEKMNDAADNAQDPRDGEQKNFEPVAPETQARLDQRKPVVCPHCNAEFIPGAKPG